MQETRLLPGAGPRAVACASHHLFPQVGPRPGVLMHGRATLSPAASRGRGKAVKGLPGCPVDRASFAPVTLRLVAVARSRGCAGRMVEQIVTRRRSRSSASGAGLYSMATTLSSAGARPPRFVRSSRFVASISSVPTGPGAQFGGNRRVAHRTPVPRCQRGRWESGTESPGGDFIGERGHYIDG